MVKAVEKLFVVEDTASNSKVLVAAGTKGAALERAIGQRFKVDVASALTTAQLIAQGVTVLPAEAPKAEETAAA